MNQFLKGALEGAWDRLKSNWKMITNPVETAKGIIDAVKALGSLTKEDIGKIVEHLKQNGYELIIKDDLSEVANKAGRLVGTFAVEILLGKGIGVALQGVKGIKAIENLVSKAEGLAKLSKAKLLEKFSDNAASIARQRIRQSMVNPKLYSGVAGAELLKDFATIAGNKIKNGSVKFVEFSKQMVDEFGEKVKPHLEKLFFEAMEKFGKVVDKNEIKSVDLKSLKPNPDAIIDPPKAIRNRELAGKKHPETDVPFDRNGYPIFNAEFEATLPKDLKATTISDYRQFKEATRQLKRKIEANPVFGKTFSKEQIEDIMAEKPRIRGFIWHHNQDGIRIQLVNEKIHSKTGHDGGRKNTGGRPK